MKNLFNLIICITLLIPINLKAREISENEALLTAKAFEQSGASIQTKSVGKNIPVKLTYTSKGNTGTNLYYVFNCGENQGFIIVSGDDRAYDILGYSDYGTFDYESLPSNMKYWLETYENELKVLINNPEMKTQKEIKTSATFEPSVKPLLGNIKWDQGSPFNNMCPTLPNGSKKVATGCVATAMAQVMYYHQWPPKGKGEHQYISSKYAFNLSANFGETNYIWDKMTPKYNSSSSAESKEAVATLMYHCGVALEMNYGPSSGAFSYMIPYSLTNYFNYDKSINIHKREYYSIGEWMDIIKTELNQKRPVIYGGQSADGGHSFVCDGYDVNNMFHINWGWSGNSDGYFQLNALTPNNQGIGGGADDGFNSQQDLITGIQKAREGSNIKFNLCCKEIHANSYETSSRNYTFSIQAVNLGNYSWTDSDCKYALGLYKGNEFIQILGTPQAFNLQPFYYYYSFNHRFNIPSSLNAGNYRIYPVFQSPGSDEWQKVKVLMGQHQYIGATLTDSEVTFSEPGQFIPSLQLTNITTNNKIYRNRSTKITFDISNTGGDFYGPLKIMVYNSTNDFKAEGSTQVVDIAGNSTSKVSFYENFNFSEGNYMVGIIDDNGYAVGEPKQFTLLPEPVASNLKLTSKPYFPDNTKVPNNDIHITATITNAGGLYADNLMASISATNSTLDGGYLNTWSEIDNGETKEIVFKGSLQDCPDGEYNLNIYYYNQRNGYLYPLDPNTNQGITFTLYTPSGSVENVAGNMVNIYPNPATSMVNIENDNEIKDIAIYDVSGKQVISFTPQTETANVTININGINNGCYFVKITDALGTKVRQLIKR